MRNSKLINALNNCIAHCNYCADACLDAHNIQMMVDCIRIDRACSEVCSATAKLLATNYPGIKDMVEYCLNICKKCANECAKHDHEHCVDCAEACRKCAKACEEYFA